MDNKSAIEMSLNPMFDERTNHIEIDAHFIRDKVMDSVIKVAKVYTLEQVADIFTISLLSLLEKVNIIIYAKD